MKKRNFHSVFAHSFLWPIAQACDAYLRTMESIEYWNSFDFSDGFSKAIDKWYAREWKITMGLLTKSPKALFDEFLPDITKLRIDVRDIDCAADDEWYHLRVFTTYYHSPGVTVSMPQYWTYSYDPATCLWAHYFILAHSNFLDQLRDVMSPKHQEL
jgi:hypothetical protein